MAAVWRAVEYLFGTLIEEGQSAGEIAASVDPIEAGRALVGLYLGLGVHVLSGEPASGVANAAGTGECCLRPADGEVSADVDAW